ncbi:MAG: 2-oxoacid:acceptor oxidoreductase family protein [Dehalococcoidia bacterium]|nr:2-oxoacid:acceptor oxidoreductase family protein [Dehalococcoidia bacterium]
MPGFWAMRDKGNPVFDTPKRGELTYTPLHNGTAEKQAMNTNLYEIRWHGRGGQGAITAAKITAQAAYLDGYHGVTAAPSFGAERRGAPVSASTRIARAPVMVMSQVEEPDVVVVLDHTLLKYKDVTSGLRPGGWLVVNSWQGPEEIKIKGDFSIATADATRVCRELGLIVAGLTVVNTAILGAFVRATEMVDMASVEKVIRERFSDSAVDMNLAAIRKTCEITRLEKAG